MFKTKHEKPKYLNDKLASELKYILTKKQFAIQ